MNQLSKQYTVFGEREMACIINKATKTTEEFQTAMNQLKAHPSLVALGPGDDGRQKYATRQAIVMESKLEDDAYKLQKNAHHMVATWRVDEALSTYKLNPGQSRALRHIMLEGDMAIIVGKAGTGKSYLMRAANEIWQQEGYRVIGTAVAGIASESLESESNIQSSTIASLKYRLEKGQIKLTDKDILVLDEAGMVDAYDMQKLLRATREAGAKLILVGDHNQVQAIGPGAPFRSLLEKIGFMELDEIIRQKQEIDRIATGLLSSGKTGQALDIYNQKGQVNLTKSSIEAEAALINKWQEHLTGDIRLNLTASIILAHRNDDVDQLNLKARAALIQSGYISSKGTAFETQSGKITLTTGDRILFTENSWKLKVKNGHFATVKRIKGSVITAVITKGDKEREVTFDASEYKHFGYGYAATIYKTQGVTVDNAFVYAGGTYWSRNLIYVALSRHRHNVYLFADAETHRNFETLKKNLSRFSIKDAVIDFPLQYAIRRGFDPEKLVVKWIESIHQAKEKVKDKWLFLANYEAYVKRVEASQKEDATQRRREDAVLVAQFVDLYREVGREWSSMKNDLKAGEEMSSHAKFSQNYDLITERNRLAFQIYSDAPKYELAMGLNSIDLSTLQPYVNSHLARERVLRYEHLAKNNSPFAAGKLAAEIAKEGKMHGQFVRERGLNWEAINGLAKVYTQKHLLFSLDKAQRGLYQDVFDYLQQARDRIVICKKQKPKPERMHWETARLDAMAYDIYRRKTLYSNALTKLNIKVDKLKLEAERHTHRQNVLAFLKAERDGHDLLKIQLAAKIKRNLADNKKSYGSVIRELTYQGMDWEKVHLNTWTYEQRIKPMRLSTDELLASKTYTQYRSYNRDLSKMIQRNKEPDEKYAAQNHNRKTKYLIIRDIVAKRDQAATQLWDNLTHIDLKAKQYEKLDIARLQKERDNHIRREEVKAHAQTWQPQSLRTQVAAKRFAANPDYAKLINEQRLKFRIEPAIKGLTKRQDFAVMTPENRALFKEAEHYRNLASQTSKAWKRNFAATKSDRAIKALPINNKIAQAFNEQKNALAFKLYQNFEQYQPHLKALNIDEARLEKAARAYQRKLAYTKKITSYRDELTQENQVIQRESYNADRISEALINMGESFYQHVLGDIYSKPKHHGHYIRVGEKEFFSFNVSGSHTGAWYSFESGEGGYPLQLLMNANYGYGLSYVEALQAGAQIAGLSDSQAKDITYVRKQKSAEEIAAEARTLAAEKQKRIESARYYFRTSQPIAGTIAETYLRETRHIEGDISGFRFHPRVKDPQSKNYYPAALIAAKDEHGRITATQTILIDPATRKKVDKAEVEVPKRTRGIISGSVALIHKADSNKVIIAEGPETAASLITAFPDANIYVTVGNIRNAQHLAWVAKKHQTDTFYFAADNDGENQKPVEGLREAAKRLEAEGIKCYKAVPQLAAIETPDFNDVLIHEGVEGVKKQMDTMHRILNESETISFGLTTTHSFEIKGQEVILSEPLKTQLLEYITTDENTHKYAKNYQELISSPNVEIRNHYNDLFEESDNKQKTLSQDLLKQHPDLWRKINKLATDDGGTRLNQATLKDEITRNKVNINHLSKLHEEVHQIAEEYKQSLRQSKSRSRRL